METEVKYTAENGINIYAYKNPALHGFYISLFIKSGSMYESAEKSGITHFLEHAVIRNINKIYGMKLYQLLDKIGLEFNAGTYSEMVNFYVTGASEAFSHGAEIISKVFDPIILDKGEIDAERKRIKAEIRESDDKNALATFAAKHIFEGTSLSQSIIGNNGAVDKITKTSLSRHHKESLSRDNIFFYVTGSFSDENIEELKALVSGAVLSDTPARDNVAPVPEKFGKRDGAVFVKKADYTMARFTFDLDMSRYSVAETDLLYDTLLSGYNSKLFVELSEERGLIYDITGGSERYRNIGTLSFNYEVKKADLEKTVDLVVDILNSLKREENIECIKSSYVDNAYLLYDDIRELNFTFAYDNHIMNEGYSSVEQRKNRYGAVSEKRLSDIAREIFTKDNLTLSLKSRGSVDTDALKKSLMRLENS